MVRRAAVFSAVAPSVSYPLFRAGAGRANVRYTEAQRDALLAYV